MTSVWRDMSPNKNYTANRDCKEISYRLSVSGMFHLIWLLPHKNCCSYHESRAICSCEISGSHGGEYEDCCLLCCSVVQSGKNLPTFQRCLLPQSSWRWMPLSPWWWRQL
jgi:hypothetical protein